MVDKGTLDALMSEDTPEVRESGSAMLREVARILKPGGRWVAAVGLKPLSGERRKRRGLIPRFSERQFLLMKSVSDQFLMLVAILEYHGHTISHTILYRESCTISWAKK